MRSPLCRLDLQTIQRLQALEESLPELVVVLADLVDQSAVLADLAGQFAAPAAVAQLE